MINCTELSHKLQLIIQIVQQSLCLFLVTRLFKILPLLNTKKNTTLSLFKISKINLVNVVTEKANMNIVLLIIITYFLLQIVFLCKCNFKFLHNMSRVFLYSLCPF